jgi:hypothetical protein
MAGIAFADAIEPTQDLGGAVSYPEGYGAEEAGQTFVEGTPVEFLTAGDGGLAVWDGTTLAAAIAGFAAENANNLGTTGAGMPGPFTPIIGPGSVIGNYAANPNQPLAVITPPMTPISDGFIRYNIAAPTTRFIGKIGTGATNQPVATALTQVGVAYGLTKDANNAYWYIDTNKTGSSAAVRIVGLSPLEAVGTVGGHVIFVVLNAVAQIFA